MLPELPNTYTVVRAFQIQEFVQTGHLFQKHISEQTRRVCKHITERTDSPWKDKDPQEEEWARRSRSPSNAPTYRYPQEWVIDRSVLKKDLSTFNFSTLYLLRHIESTPSASDVTEPEDNTRHTEPEDNTRHTEPEDDTRHTSVDESIHRGQIPRNMADDNAGEGSSNQGRNQNQPQQPAPVAGFTTEQWAAIVNLIRSTPAATTAGSTNATPPPAVAVTPVDHSQRDWKAEEVGFFDTGLEDPDDAPFVTVGRHTFYRDVYAFVDRLKDVAKQRAPEKLRAILPECFRGEAQSWYSIELGETEKDLLRLVSLDGWYEQLIKRFKTRTPKAWELLQKEKYTLNDARNHKHPRAYVQNVLRYARAAEVPSVQNQLSIAWNNLAVEFRIHMPEPSSTTTVKRFMERLDAQADMWMELARRSGTGSHNQSSRSAGKQPARQQGQQQQRPERKFVPYYGQPPADVPYYPRQNYDNNRAQYSDRPYAPRSLPPGKQPLLLEGAPKGSPSKPAQKSSSAKKPEKRPWRKPTAYAAEDDEYADDQEEEGDEQEMTPPPDPDGYYVEDPDMDYYNPAYQSEEEENTPTALAVSPVHVCRRCQAEFRSNNLLHKHIRTRSCLPKPSVTASATAFHGEVEIIESTASVTDIGTGFGFRNYHFLTLFVALTATAVAIAVCMDSGCSVTLIDRAFLLEQAPNTRIRTMASPISVRGIGSNHHSTNEYVLLEIYLPGTRNGKDVRAKITREAHLVDGLKAKMLLGTDVMGPEKIDIMTSQNQAYIGSCDTTVPIDIKPRTRGVTMKPVVTEKQTTVPAHSQMVVPVYHATLPSDRDFLFEPGPTSAVSLCAHLVDDSFHSVIATNETDEPIVLPKHLRLGTVSDIDYDNCYLAAADEADIAKLSRTSQENAWYDKELLATLRSQKDASESAQDSSSQASNLEADSLKPSARPPKCAKTSAMEETKMANGVTIFGNSEAAAPFRELVEAYPQLWEDHGSFANLPEQQWMTIPLRSDWEKHAPTKVKVYPLGTKDREVVDRVFDKLHAQGRLSWTDSVGTTSTPFSYPVFVVWKTLPNGEREGRPVMDVRGLNKLAQNDVHPVPLQADVIAFVRGCPYITILDALSFFYHWRVARHDRYKQTVVSHRGQETFNVAVMGYKGSVAYVQRQIERILRELKDFAKAYIDDIVVASRTLQEHLIHLDRVFQTLVQAGICIKPIKAFIGYPSIELLGEHVDSMGLTTSEEKIRAISSLTFPDTLRKLETYLGLTGWLRKYVSMYAAISKPLQDRKTNLLKGAPQAGSARKVFSARTRFDPTVAEVESFRAVQAALSKPTFLVHFDPARPLFIDLDSSKEAGIGAMIYHVQPKASDVKSASDVRSISDARSAATMPASDRQSLPKASSDIQSAGDTDSRKSASEVHTTYPARKDVQPILFLSRIINGAESRYWPTELELAGIVWVVRKVRHMIESSQTPTTIFTDHGSALGIAKQTSLTSSSTDKLNLRLVRASDYLQRFELIIKHKPGKQHVVPDALSRLDSTQKPPVTQIGELDALHGCPENAASLSANATPTEKAYCFTAALVEMSPEFKQRLVEGYRKDRSYKHIIKVLDSNSGEGTARLPFTREPDGLIFRLDASTGDHAYVPRRLCVPDSCVQDILEIAHGEGHPGYARCLQKASAWYIRHLARRVRDYIHHCPKCQVYQTKRHAPYGAMQPIQSPPAPFHTITIDFILSLPLSVEGYDIAMSVTCKFTKRVTVIPGKATGTAQDWAKALLNQLALVDWGLPKVILSDRDRKFLGDLWSELFKLLGVGLLYSTAYHPQSDGQSERSNQTIEIALRYYLSCLDDPRLWPTVLPRLQAYLNNSISATTGKTPNEAAYGFTPVAALDLGKLEMTEQTIDQTATRLEISDAIAFAQMKAKFYYDQSHIPLNLKVGQYALLRLHKGYHIPSVTSRKLGAQRVGPFKVLEKIGNLAYRLDLPPHWRIHPVISVAHLEPCPGNDPYKRPRPSQPAAVSMEGDVGVYVIEKLLDRRQSRRGAGWCVEYLVRWEGYGPEFDVWYNIKDLDDAPELVKECDERLGLTKASNASAVAESESDQPASYAPTSSKLPVSKQAIAKSDLSKASASTERALQSDLPRKPGRPRKLLPGLATAVPATVTPEASKLSGQKTTSQSDLPRKPGRPRKLLPGLATAAPATVTPETASRSDRIMKPSESKAIAVVIPSRSQKTPEENRALITTKPSSSLITDR